jgi:hypothetical protein
MKYVRYNLVTHEITAISKSEPVPTTLPKKLVELGETLDYDMTNWLDVIELVYMITMELKLWYNGMTGMNKKLSAKITGSTLKYLSAVGSIYGKPRAKLAYRMSSLTVGNSSKEKILKLKKAKVGGKDLSSFTYDKSYPEIFYKKFYADTTTRTDRRFAYVVLVTPITEKNYVFDLDSSLSVLKDIKKIEPDFVKHKLAKEYLLSRQLKETSKDINSKFIQEQDEVILRTSGEIPIKILKILNYNGT